MLAELWVATGDATWIYNQGRCYEQNGMNELAASRFREYLRKAKDLPAEDVAAINRRIDELQRQKSAPAAPPATVINLVQPVAPLPAQRERSAELVTPRQPLPAPEAPVYKRWWFWTGIGAVVAGGIATAILLSHRGTKSPACDQGVACVP